MSESHEKPSTKTLTEIITNQDDCHYQMAQSEKSLCNLSSANVNPSISSSGRIDETLGLPLNDSNQQANITSSGDSGRTLSSRLSERIGRPSFSLAGIFSTSEENGDAVGVSNSVRDTHANEYTPLGSPTRQPLLLTTTDDENKKIQKIESRFVSLSDS